MKEFGKINDKLPYLMQYYSGLRDIPWIKLINSPTPVQRLVGLERELNFKGLFIKRDDLTNPDYGGNKPRKFEFLLGHALKRMKKHILTMGGIGSNHCVANSMFCKQLGLKSIVYLQNQPLTEHVRENLLLELYYNAKIVHKKTELGLALSMLGYMSTHWRSYLIWAGGSNKIGTLGFVNAAFELKNQIDSGICPEPDFIFTTTGSSGTTAGLTLGCELAGMKSKIMGITVSTEQWASKKRVMDLALKCLKYMKKYDFSIPDVSYSHIEDRFEINTNYFGGIYGIVTDKGLDAVNLIKKTDGITLETTYTGKTLSALLSFVDQFRDILQNKIVLFWNTYNSSDQSPKLAQMDYHNLHKKMHQYFDGSVPLSITIVPIVKKFKEN